MKTYEVGAHKLAVHHSPIKQDHLKPVRLLPGGLSRFNDIQPYLPICRETWRLLVNGLRAPQPIRMSKRCTVWRNDEVNAWLANPAAFSVEG
ncbi:transcriptional regulator [Paraburkholderia madseniana]|uniref:Transcriptional regulator n=1 Tax=Paraburkholderia madseniana TaxID=2599607 RepID=A0AAP5BH50_9BURK|nr:MULTISPECIES: transcriptional regulator [Paraburkholderia]MCX4148462.1 transcriptional regulator [Paraburkholderia madseniana]MDN7151400.1 transcriptional regulator [Paraburkholderia sp. WS6]MDQ6410280.1 transcriptional regulator [Paraburkholderia madseniana]